ncbi:hypothetical protein M426DRAFT_8168 [Hypoxylon sp. CI-4A]|nr:hypothetical protein M426DRAFT_8168 [Hypoxylon sp. CI-4A]
MTAPSVPRKRACRPKVRSGCLTCKQRRVKCDEGRPTCRRCLKNGLVCKYESSERDQSERQSQRKILPASKAAAKEQSVGLVLSTTKPRHSDFDEPEILYFDLFRTAVVENLCMNGYTNLWSRTVLRESFRDECVRDCVLAIGALCRNLKPDQRPQLLEEKQPLWMVLVPTVKTKFERDAYHYFNKAISRFRTRLEREGSAVPSRTILILSLLFIMFEAVQGNTESVDKLMCHAVMALKGSMHRPCENDSTVTAIDDEGVQEADFLLTRLSGYSALLSPFHPSLFHSQVYRQIGIPNTALPKWSESPQQIQIAFEKYTTATMIWCFRKYQDFLSVNLETYESDLVKDCGVQQQTVSVLTKDWTEFIAKKADREKDPIQRLTWKRMLVEAKMYNVYTSSCYGVEEYHRMWDARLDECREALEIAECVLNEVPMVLENKPPLFEDKMLPALRCFASACRDYKTRKKALELCRRLTGPWFENRAVLAGLTVMIELEEQDRDADGFIPIWARNQWAETSWSEDRTEMRMVLQSVTGVRREIFIRQDADLDDLVTRFEKLSAQDDSDSVGSPDQGGSSPIVIYKSEIGRRICSNPF